MLELGSSYLPTNSSWNRYISESDLTFEEFEIELKTQMSKKAYELCALLDNDKYKHDLWIRDQDWTLGGIKLKKGKYINKNKKYSVDEINETKAEIPLKIPILAG